MGDDPAHPLGHQEVSDDEDADHLVPPVTPPGLSPDGGEWDFSDRLAAGVVSRTSSQGSGRHPQPTRHASLDAGYLQQRLYAAAHAVLLPGSSGAPHEQGALGVDKGSRGVHSAGGATPNDGIEIAWVWPPCLANDTGPVEFAVNVAPREWLNGKHSHRRVPCWPVSGLSLHITCGEQLLSVVELDICGTTKVRLQLPRTLTSPHLNFITVMLVDNGKVGPATQLLTMPSSAADEFSGLFRILVEHEMLPQHTAAHPEYVSMLFGSSGCSSGSGTVRSYNSFLSLNGGAQGAGAAVAAAAAAAGVAAGRISPHRAAAAAAAAAAGTTSVGAGGPSPLPGLDVSFLQQQLLLQGQHRQHLRHRKHKARRHSAGYVQVSGSPAVVRQWCTGSAAAGRLSVGSDAGARGAAASSSSSRTRKAAAVAERAPRPRRASDGEAFLHSASMLEAASVEDSSGGTLTTIEGSVSTSNQVSNSRLHMLAPSPDGAEQQQVLGCAGAGAAQLQGAGQPQQQQQQLHAQVHSRLSSGRLSTLSSGDLPRFGAWEAAVAGDAHAAGLLLIGDGDDAEELHADKAAAGARAAGASSTAGQTAAAGAQVIQQQQQQHRGLTESDVQQQEGRKSLSLDRCAVHVHNEVERAQLTRTRMSMDEGGRNRMSLDGGMRGGGSGGNLQLAAPDAAAGGPAGAAAVNLTTISSSALFTATGYPGVASSSTEPAVVAAAAAAAALTQQGPAPTVSVAAPLGSAGAAAAASTAVGADVANAAQAAAGPRPATAATAEQAVPGALQQQSVPDTAEAAVPQMLVGGRGLERRTAAEANMSAAFTTAWTCHMLELASDLQYLVVCVPNAFASSLETWFGRIVDSRAGGSSAGSSTQQGGAAAPAPGWSAAGLPGPGGSAASGDRRAESSWDSGMYMKRLGQVLDTLQEHKMWTTMSLLLQHCSSGGLDLYPAGCLHQFLQQQLTQQQQQQPKQQQQQQPKQQQQQQLQGPLHPGSLTPAYLANLGSMDVGSASYWVRPVPAMLNTQLSRMPRVAGNGAAQVPGRADSLQVSSTALSSSSKPGAAAGLQSVRAAHMQAAGARGRGAASIDLTPTDLADARRAAAAAAADSRAGGRFPPTSSSSASRRPLRQQQHEQHRAPRRSMSWPLGVLYSAFSWAQTAQSRHRQRSFWQRAWGLHPLIEGSERGSESSAASSIDASSYRSSSSTQRSSTVTSLDDMAPWARRVSSGLGRLAGGPAAAVAAAAAAAATGGRSSRGSQQRDAAAGRVSERSSNASERNNTPARASWTAGVDGRPDAAARSSTAAAAVMAVAGPASRSCDVASVQGADATGARNSTSAAQRIAALQTSLLAQAALPPEKVESLKAAAQARAQQQQQGQTGVKAQQPPADVQPLAAPAGAGASGVAACAVDGAAGSSRGAAEQLQKAGSSKPPARELDAADAAVSQEQQRDASAGPTPTAAGVAAEQEQGLATPDVAAAVATAAAAVDVIDDARTAAAGAGPAEAAVTAAVLGAEAVSSSAVLGLTRQQRKAAASVAAAHAADHRASVVAAALTVVGVVELCASQLLMVFMLLYCLCFLPSIIPGLQPPHLVEAMSRRPAWMEGLLLLLLGLHWFAVTNVSIVRPSSQRPRTSMEAHRAAVAAVQTASSVAAVAAAAAAEHAAAVEAGRRRRREEHRLQRLRERQQRLLGRAMLSSVAAAVALGLLCYSLCVFAAAWADHMLGDGAGVVFLYRKWNEWQQRV